MVIRASTLIACLLLASAAMAETIYKHRAADGTVTYSSRPIPGAELIETIEYMRAAPAPSAPAFVAPASGAGAAVDARIGAQISARDKAWTEVQDASRGLAIAEKLLRDGVPPLLEEGTSLAGPDLVVPLPDMTGKTDAEKAAIVTSATEKAQNESQAIGGPQKPASSAVGGRLPGASAAVGGPMARLGGGGRNQDYVNRLAALETDVRVARTRLDLALRNYNQLR